VYLFRRQALSSAATIIFASGYAFADAPGLLDEDYVRQVAACVQTELVQLVKDNTLLYRTATRYLTAGGNNDNSCTMKYTPCGRVGGSCADPRSGGIVVKPTDIVEGKVLVNGIYKKFRFCDRYIFVPPLGNPHLGTETFETFVSINAQGTTMACTLYTAGENKPGGAGGHVYGACTAQFQPTLNSADTNEATERCMDKIP
jgi:hypothetical protein